MKISSSHRRWWWCLRFAVGLVWLYQGLWHKLLAVDARHLEIVAAAPSFLPPRVALAAIGAWETLLGLAVWFRWGPRPAAWLQIGTMIAMNTAGILFAGDKIPDIGGMLTMNMVFILAIWGLSYVAPHE